MRKSSAAVHTLLHVYSGPVETICDSSLLQQWGGRHTLSLCSMQQSHPLLCLAGPWK